MIPGEQSALTSFSCQPPPPLLMNSQSYKYNNDGRWDAPESMRGILLILYGEKSYHGFHSDEDFAIFGTRREKLVSQFFTEKADPGYDLDVFLRWYSFICCKKASTCNFSLRDIPAAMEENTRFILGRIS